MESRMEERFAFEVVRRVLGSVVEPHDDNTRPRMVDAIVTHADGTRGALEVTTLGDRVMMESERLLSGRRLQVEGAEYVDVDGAQGGRRVGRPARCGQR